MEPAAVAEAPVEPVPPAAEPVIEPAAESAEPAPEPRPTAVPRPRRQAPTPRPAALPVASAPEEPAVPQRVAAFAPVGTLIEARVESELSTERNAAGDRFFATLADDVLGANGEVLIPAGATLNGRVAKSRESRGPDQPAVLAVEVESVTSGGHTFPLYASVIELEAEVEARDSNTRTAAKVGVGAAAGALIGRILGNDGKDAAKGAVAGAAAGAAVAVATRDGHAVVKPGARLIVRLEERLVVEQ